MVDDFGIKYINKKDADHIIAALQVKYEVTQDWTLYGGIQLVIVVRLEGEMVLWSAQILEYVEVRTILLNWRKDKCHGRLGAMLTSLGKMCRHHQGKIDS